ncbi:DUF402 domain-containing protein [uncultured Corynebacterium sp.]|uniref:DUF402 domain-containing protein n=1 Tax=uncultured Corynebacterium sp. TaxID=159447 RepID=UPI0025EF9DA5|nr:DUF402 domain-containing protein [uncultured Corynebacterium sp.]
MSEPHAPKLETFDVDARANVDPKGFVRAVDAFEIHPHGLYMRRGSDHPKFGYLESWLLPSLGLRANIFHFRPGADVHSHRYLDVAAIGRASAEGSPDGATGESRAETGHDVWTTRDLYLDVLELDGRTHVEDADELTAAVAAGLVSPDDAAWAIDRAFDALAGITAHHGDVDAWLAARGCPVTWADDVEIAPPNQPAPKRVAIGAGPGADEVGGDVSVVKR